MKIGIDARFYSESGVGRYLRNLIVNLKMLDKNNEYFIFLLPKDYAQFEETKNFQKVSADYKWYGFAEQFKFPQLLNKFKLDIVHFPHFNVPIFYKGKFVVTIHDLIHQHYVMSRATTLNPLTYNIKRLGYRKVFKTAIQKSLKILVPSDFVKKDLIKEWNVSPDKIIATPEAVDDTLFAIAKKVSPKKLDRALFLFYVGNAHPHKNIEGLIKVFLRLKKNYKDLKLVLAGADHYFWQRIKKEFQHEDIYYKGYISDEELVEYYKSAVLFVLPSFEEGFGIPLLEAMALGCPVVCSSVAALPEVGGDACVYFDPRDSDDIEKKISSVLDSKVLQGQLAEKGLERSRQFSWRKLAQKTLEVYLK